MRLLSGFTSRLLGVLVFLCVLSGAAAHAAVINLQDYVPGTGSVFCGAGPAQTVTITNVNGYDVVLSGGTPLGPGIANLPATSSVAYGTADFANGCSGQSGYTNPLTIQFFATGTSNALGVNNFFVDLYNGNTVAVDYTIQDNLGDGGTVNIADNIAGGQHTFGFASAGDVITIAAGPALSGCCQWDFFINNIGFDEALPTGSDIGVPEPATLGLLASGLAGLVLVRRRRSVAAASTGRK